jgi:hypothetical protein
MRNGKEYNVTWNPVHEKGYPSFDAVNSETISVTKTVHIKEFPTYVLVGDLYNRIYDSIHDEEPVSDRFLETISKEAKEHILATLTKVVDDIQ